MSKPIDPEQRRGVLLGTSWARRRYYIDEGYIKPIPGARTEWYNPFDKYYGLDNAWQGDSFYLELVDLKEWNQRAVEDFVSKWGLLGLVFDNLIQAHYVRTPEGYALPKHGLDSALPGFDELWQGKGFTTAVPLYPPFVPQDVIWNEMVHRGWVDRGQNGGFRVKGETTFAELEERLTREYEQTEFSNMQLDIQNGGQVLARDSMGVPRMQSLAEYLKPYFPDPIPRPKSFGPGLTLSWLSDADPVFPALDSDFIWDYLCEPLDAFVMAVSEFRELFKSCTQSSTLSRDQLRWVRSTFDRHLEAVHPSIDIPEEEHQAPALPLVAQWAYPSLLSAAYMMLYLDFTGNRRLRFCANEKCRKSFVTDRTDKIYCSYKCLNASKRRTPKKP